MPVKSDAHVIANFALALDGFSNVGFLKSVDGGAIKADIVNEKIGAEMFRNKHIGNTKYEPISLQVGMSMSKPFYQLIEKAWAGEIVRVNGAIQACDHNMKVQHEQTFENALITETTIPTLDASAGKESAFMTVKLAPETSRHKAGSGGSIGSLDLKSSQQKSWLPSKFRFELDGMEAPGVSKIESFTVKQTTALLPVGKQRDYQIEPTSLEFPNLTIWTSLTRAQPWVKWHDDFLIKGNSGPDKEKNGAIVFLSPDLKKELLRIELKGVGISGLQIDKADASSDSIRKVKIELYVEEMVFDYLA